MSILSNFRARMAVDHTRYYVIHYWTEPGGAAAYSEWEVPGQQFASISEAIQWLAENRGMFEHDTVQVSIIRVDAEGLHDVANPRG